MKLLAAGLCALALVSDARVGCKDKTQASGPCNIKYHVCGQIDKLKLKYKATATDLKSGISASGGRHDSSTGAAEDAAVQLFHTMNITHPTIHTSNATDPCSCYTIIEDINKNCVLQADICFYFLSTSDFNPVNPSYRAWLLDTKTNATGYNDNGAGHNYTQALTSAFYDLANKEPTVLAKCSAESMNHMLQLAADEKKW